MLKVLLMLLLGMSSTAAAVYSTHPQKPTGTINSTQDGSAGETPITSTQPHSLKDTIKSTNHTNPYYELTLRDDVIYLTPEVCRSLMIAYRTPDSVKYKPDVDVKGNPLAPVDINPPGFDLPKTIRIPIRYSRLSRSELGVILSPADSALNSQYIDEIPLGILDFELESGELKFNGQFLTKDKNSFIRQKCRELLE